MKIVFKMIGLGLLAFLVSLISSQFYSGRIETEFDTIGVISKRGFPLSFIQSAPGYSIAHSIGTFSPWRFIVNTVIWLAMFVGAYVLFQKSRRDQVQQ